MAQVLKAVQTLVPPNGKEKNKRKRKSNLKYLVVNKSATVLFCLPFLYKESNLGMANLFFYCFVSAFFSHSLYEKK